jgi:NADPH-dependent 2,4-dienoyl-CoA reductase/sulfur reductase-like enzyme
LRAAGFDGALTLLGAEADPPYDRPPLSKGAVGADTGDLGFDFDELRVAFQPNTAAVGLLGASVAATEPLLVLTDDGAEVTADAVVVATGAAPIVPPGWRTSDRILLLRTRAEAVALDHLIAPDQGREPIHSLAVLGGSWIGLEVASRVAAQGVDVTVVERAAWLLGHLPPELGRLARTWCDHAGISVHLGLPVEAAVDTAAVDTAAVDGAHPPEPVEVRFGDTTLHAGAALVALGVRPATAWLAESGLTLVPGTQALRVDAWLRSADPRVLGVGDAVSRWSPRYRAMLPGGHWQDAFDAPAVAARSLVAGLTPGAADPAPYDAVPYFWSEMFGRTLQWTGYLPDYRAARLIVRGDAEGDSWSMCWLDEEDRLAALLACDRPRDAVAARKAQAAAPQGAPWADVDKMSDPDCPLKSCLSVERGE